jgi:hypothetical protein
MWEGHFEPFLPGPTPCMNWISTVTGLVSGGWNTRLTWRFSGFFSSASLFLMRRTLVVGAQVESESET